MAEDDATETTTFKLLVRGVLKVLAVSYDRAFKRLTIKSNHEIEDFQERIDLIETKHNFTLKVPADISCSVKVNSKNNVLYLKIDGKKFDHLSKWKDSSVPFADDIQNEPIPIREILRDPFDSSDDEADVREQPYTYDDVDVVY